MNTRTLLRTAVVVAGLAAAGQVAGPAMAQTKAVTRADLVAMGYKCERVGIGGWECVRRGDVWLCPNQPEGACIDLVVEA
jgi:hypothetical protein